MGGQSEGGKYDIHTTLLDADERALQKAHEIVGVAIENMKDGIFPTLADIKEARELIGNVLASAEPA